MNNSVRSYDMGRLTGAMAIIDALRPDRERALFALQKGLGISRDAASEVLGSYKMIAS